MSSVNKVILLGNIGKDPEVRETKAGNIVNLVMATSEKYTDKIAVIDEQQTINYQQLFQKVNKVSDYIIEKSSRF